MMKRRTFLNLTTVLGAGFCSGLSASAQILQPTLPSSINLHIKDLKNAVRQNFSKLGVQNHYALAEDLFSIQKIVKEEYKGQNYAFSFKNHSGQLIHLSNQKGILQTKIG